MNIKQINEIRAGMGLEALTAAKNDAAKKRRENNHAVRAQANRDLKAKRNRNGK
jgi:hypothetical protein